MKWYFQFADRAGGRFRLSETSRRKSRGKTAASSVHATRVRPSMFSHVYLLTGWHTHNKDIEKKNKIYYLTFRCIHHHIFRAFKSTVFTRVSLSCTWLLQVRCHWLPLVALILCVSRVGILIEMLLSELEMMHL
jgi:hypothetical protein